LNRARKAVISISGKTTDRNRVRFSPTGVETANIRMLAAPQTRKNALSRAPCRARRASSAPRTLTVRTAASSRTRNGYGPLLGKNTSAAS